MLNTLQNAYRHAVDTWLFQLREAETGEVFLNQRRVFILPTRAGLGFGLMLLLLFTGSVNYNLNLGLALTFLLAACAVIDMHLTFRNLAHLHLAAGRAPAVFAGEEARFEVHLINRRKHARYAIRVGFMGEGQPGVEQPVDIGEQDSTTLVLGTPAGARGWLPAPRVRLQTQFPLGLLRAWSYWKPDARVLVYPHPEEGAPPLPLAHDARDDGQGPGGQEDFAGVRAYQAGDSPKRLAWRQIARLGSDEGGSLVTKHFEGGASSELTLDYFSLPAHLDVEARLSRLTRWVLEAEAQGLPYALRIGEAALEPALGPAHRKACLQALALYGIKGIKE